MDDSVNRRRVERSRRRPSTRGGGARVRGCTGGPREERGDEEATALQRTALRTRAGQWRGPSRVPAPAFRTCSPTLARGAALPLRATRGRRRASAAGRTHGADSRGEGCARPAARRSSRCKCACREVLDDGGALSAERPLEVVDEALSFCLALIILSQVSFRDPP